MSRIECWQRMKDFWTKILLKEENLSQISFSFVSWVSFSMEDCSFAIWEFYYKYLLSVLSLASTFWGWEEVGEDEGWRRRKGKSRLFKNLGNFAADHRWDLGKSTQEAVIIFYNGRKFLRRSLPCAGHPRMAASEHLLGSSSCNQYQCLSAFCACEPAPPTLWPAGESSLQQALKHGLLLCISTRHKRPVWWCCWPTVMDNWYLCLGWDIWSQLGACWWADDCCSHREPAGHGRTSVWTQYCDESCSCLFCGFKGSHLMFKSMETLNEPTV